MNDDSTNRAPLCDAALRFMDRATSCGGPPDAASGAHTQGDILKHIGDCPDCSREFALRGHMAAALKRAVLAQPEAPFLAAKISRAIAERDRRAGSGRWVWQFAAPAVALLVFLGAWLSYSTGHFRLTRSSQDSYIAAISSQIPGILRVGLSDHVHCAVFRKFPKQPPAATAMMSQLGPEYQSLMPVVQERVPAEFRVIMAHRCSYRGRRFVHLALKGQAALVSLVIARRSPGESFHSSELKPALAEAGMPLYRGGVQRFTVAGFETRDHLVYLVSDLDGQRNSDLLASLAEPLRDILARLES
jgi:hypothetical protein